MRISFFIILGVIFCAFFVGATHKWFVKYMNNGADQICSGVVTACMVGFPLILAWLLVVKVIGQ